MVSATVACASAVPLIADVVSPALTMSSPATVAIVGAFGATVSTEMARDTAAETLPAASVARAVSVSAPCPMAEMSASVRV